MRQRRRAIREYRPRPLPRLHLLPHLRAPWKPFVFPSLWIPGFPERAGRYRRLGNQISSMCRQRVQQLRSSNRFRIPTFFFQPFCCLLFFKLIGFRIQDLGGATSISFVTFPAPATAAAFASMSAFSFSVRTGPFNVTLPSCAITLMLWAYVESALSSIIDARILRASSRSVGFIFCWSAVVAPFWASPLFARVLSGAVCCEVAGRGAPETIIAPLKNRSRHQKQGTVSH